MKKRMRRNPDVAEKVRELKKLLGGRRVVVHYMRAASVSSLRRWEYRQCKPLRAHRHLVGDVYGDILKIRHSLGKIHFEGLKRELEKEQKGKSRRR